jgi:hypothetical protein
MNWYFVKLVFQIVSDSGTAQFDEQMRLIQADELAWAVEKASVLGWLEESTFKSSYSKQVTWKFIGVADIHKLTGLEDGTQLCSATVQPDCPKEYLQLIELNRVKALAMIAEEFVEL